MNPPRLSLVLAFAFAFLCQRHSVSAQYIVNFGNANDKYFRVAAYNVENYLDQPGGTRPLKSAEAKAKVRESIRAMNPHVIALEEMGQPSALQELRESLKTEGFDYPFWEHVTGFDTNIFVAMLSKYPIVARRPHTNQMFLLSGRRFQVSRGFVDVDIKVNDKYQFTLIAAHLKSKRPVPVADESELRMEEAKALRAVVDARLQANPNANIVVLGDFNDTKDSPSTKAIVGKGKFKLVDTRPAERNGDNPSPRKNGYAPAKVTWTYFYEKEDGYFRIDYLLLSPGMSREWVQAETYIPAITNWGIGSDHRPLLATFEATDK